MHTNSTIVRNVCLLLAGLLVQAPAAVRGEDDLAQSVTTLLLDKDKDFRAVGLEQVREGLKGAEFTQRFAALVPQLPPDGQALLIIALGDRGDATALPAIKSFISSNVPAIRAAAIRAVGALGNKDEAATLVPLLGNPATAADAEAAILCLQGAGVPQSLLAEAKQSAALRVAVYPLL